MHCSRLAGRPAPTQPGGPPSPLPTLLSAAAFLGAAGFLAAAAGALAAGFLAAGIFTAGFLAAAAAFFAGVALAALVFGAVQRVGLGGWGYVCVRASGGVQPEAGAAGRRARSQIWGGGGGTLPLRPRLAAAAVCGGKPPSSARRARHAVARAAPHPSSWRRRPAPWAREPSPRPWQLPPATAAWRSPSPGLAAPCRDRARGACCGLLVRDAAHAGGQCPIRMKASPVFRSGSPAGRGALASGGRGPLPD